jgi:hypothetical protein
VAGVEFVSAESNVETGEVFLKRYRYEQLVTYQLEGNKLLNIVFTIGEYKFGNGVEFIRNSQPSLLSLSHFFK